MNVVMREFIKAVREGARLFFLPLTGAIGAIRLEMERIRHNRHAENDVNSQNNFQD
jgi:hypothetical protein